MNLVFRDAAIRAFLLVAALSLAACGGGGSAPASDPTPPVATPPDPVEPPPPVEPTTGTVGIFFTDGPMEEFDQILVDVTRIDLLGNGAPVTVLDEPVTIDLKALETTGELVSLADDVPPGEYTEIRLYVDEIRLIELDDDGETVLETVRPKLPSGTLKLKPRGPFTVVAGESLLVQIDIDANKSIKFQEKGNGGWQFRPVVHVSIGDADDFARLARIYGRIDEVFVTESRFRLCQTELTSDDDDEDDYEDDERCVLVNVLDDTGLFGESGEPIDFTDLDADQFATVAGFVQNHHDDDDDPDEGRGDDDDDDDDDDSSGSGSGRDDSDDDSPFEIDAVVVMRGEKGTFRTYRGLVAEDLDTQTGEFSIDLDADQGIETDSPLAALFQDGTRVFDRRGVALDPTAIATGVRGHFDGRLVLANGDPDVLRTALIVLDLRADGDAILRGVIGSFTSNGFNLMTATGDRCVETDDRTDVLLIVPDGEGIRSEPGTLDDLESGQEVDVYGDEEDSGCFEADSIVVDLTVEAVPPGNRAPTANAGPDQQVDQGAGAMLDGSASSDPDGDTLTFAWTLTAPGGSTATLDAADTAKPSFVTDVLGDYVAELTVDDGEFTDSDSVTVTAVDPNTNQAPIANAGADQNVTTGDPVTLDGSGSSDPDGDAITYLWSLDVPTGSSATLNNATIAGPSFTTDVAGTYTATLVVNDGSLDSAADAVVVTAEDPPPPPPPAQGLDGEQLYNNNCTGSTCHGSFANAPNWSATRIESAIRNVGIMGLVDLTAEEIQAIADALAARP